MLSCKSNKKNIAQDSVTNITATNTSNSLIDRFKPIIQGAWVKADYIEKVIRTKSPAASEDLATGITCFYINTDLIKDDSLVFMAGYGNHEGGNVSLRFKPGKIPSSICLADGYLTYSVTNGDTSLFFTQYHIKTHQPIVTKYKRALIKQPNDNLAYGMNYLVNKGLIAGTYLCIDSLGHQSTVRFTNEGKVESFENFKSFAISTDIGGEPRNNLDGIVFEYKDVNKGNKFFTYKINADTLKIFDVYANADSTEDMVGNLKYKLVRQKK